MAKPPPKRSNIPQGNLTASSQCIIFSSLFFPLVLNKNKEIPDIKAIIESSRLGKNKFKKNVLEIHATPVITKTTKTIFSS